MVKKMSEPVSNVEIEDVLSSIRRLVSDENRPAPRPESEDVPYKPTRLVLTPSLLVPESSGSGHSPETPVASESDDDAEGFGVETEEAEETLESLAGTPDVAEADDKLHSDAEPQADADNSDRFVFSELTPEPEVEDRADSSHMPWIDPDATLFEAAETSEFADFREDDDTDHQTVEASLAEEQSPADQYEAPETQHGESQFDEVPDDAGQDLSGVLDSADDPEDAAVDDAAEDLGEKEQVEFVHRTGDMWALREDAVDTDEQPDDDQDPDGDDEPYNTATLSAKIAALEAKIGQTSDQWEPDGELGDDYAGTRVETIEWQDHDAAETDADIADAGVADMESVATDEPVDVGVDVEPAQDAPESDMQAGPDMAASQDGNDDHDEDALDILSEEEAILDEESLRELVAEIVRQELQGALGERITRNVRKLVRREIHRALTAQDLD